MKVSSLGACFLASLLVSSCTADRSDAFIGYSEGGKAAKLPKCVDKDAKSCALWEKDKQCIDNPYYMRESCPNACKVISSYCTTGKYKNGPWDGYASDVGTRLYATMYPQVVLATHFTHWRKDPSMGEFEVPGQSVRGNPWLWLSSLGMGTYLGDADASTDHHVAAALITSIQSGFNVIDTAPNYREGRGEVAISQGLEALRDTIRLGLRRDMLFFSTKAGYAPAGLLARLLTKKLIKDGDVVDGHCIHPECIKASLKGSLERMNLATVDLLYLHNAAEAQLVKVGREAFMERLKAAFRGMEGLRTSNKIRAYGMATWDCFRVPPGSPTYLSLQEVIRVAESVGGPNHGFRYIQLPINLNMPEAWSESYQTVDGRTDGRATEDLPLLRAAGRLGVGVFASGPLGEGKVLTEQNIVARLNSAPELSKLPDESVRALQVVRSTPYLLSAIVGHKTPSHVSKNTALAKFAVLTAEQYTSVQVQVAGGNPKAMRRDDE